MCILQWFFIDNHNAPDSAEAVKLKLSIKYGLKKMAECFLVMAGKNCSGQSKNAKA